MPQTKTAKLPLMYAAQNNYPGIARLLIEKGASINAKEFENGQTALLYAAQDELFKCNQITY